MTPPRRRPQSVTSRALKTQFPVPGPGLSTRRKRRTTRPLKPGPIRVMHHRRPSPARRRMASRRKNYPGQHQSPSPNRRQCRPNPVHARLRRQNPGCPNLCRRLLGQFHLRRPDLSDTRKSHRNLRQSIHRYCRRRMIRPSRPDRLCQAMPPLPLERSICGLTSNAEPRPVARPVNTPCGGQVSSTASNSRHSRADIPALSASIFSPASIRRIASMPRAEIVAPPRR